MQKWGMGWVGATTCTHYKMCFYNIILEDIAFKHFIEINFVILFHILAQKDYKNVDWNGLLEQFLTKIQVSVYFYT